MGSGCFSPTMPKGHIDIQIIDAIYEDIRNTDFTSFGSSYLIKESCEQYDRIKQKIIKRGLVKKLCDYLSTHRFRICDTLTHNLRIVTQTKSTPVKYTVIIILEQIFKILPKSCEPNTTLCQSLKTIQSCRNVINKEEQNQSIYCKNSYTIRNNSQMLISQPNNFHSRSLMMNQITSIRFESIYLNLISYLLRQNQDIYQLALNNLQQYCQFNRNSFKTEEIAEEIIKIIMNHISMQEKVLKSLKALQTMLKKMKCEFFINNFDIVKTIIELWISEGQQESSSQFERLEEVQLCFQICQEYLRNLFEVTPALFHIFFSILDKRQFDNIQAIQQFMFSLISEHELRQQFIKNLLLGFFAYVSFTTNHLLKQSWQNLFLEYSYAQFSNNFQKITNSSTKRRSIQKINKWLNNYSGIDLENMLTYHSKHLISAFTFNLCSQNKQIKNTTICEIINLTNNLKKKHRLLLLKSLVSLSQQINYTENQKFTIFAICVRIISKQSQIQDFNCIEGLIPTISSDNCLELNQKIIQYIGLLLSKVTSSALKIIINEVCTFLMSIYEFICFSKYSLQGKVEILKKYVQIIKLLPHLQYEGIIISLSQKLISQKINDIENKSKYELLKDYFLFINLQFLNLEKSNDNVKQTFLELSECKKEQYCEVILEKYLQNKVEQTIIFDQKNTFLREQSHIFFVNYEEKYLSELRLTMSGFRYMNSVLSAESCPKQEDNNIDSVIDVLRK